MYDYDRRRRRRRRKRAAAAAVKRVIMYYYTVSRAVLLLLLLYYNILLRIRIGTFITRDRAGVYVAVKKLKKKVLSPRAYPCAYNTYGRRRVCTRLNGNDSDCHVDPSITSRVEVRESPSRAIIRTEYALVVDSKRAYGKKYKKYH